MLHFYYFIVYFLCQKLHAIEMKLVSCHFQLKARVSPTSTDPVLLIAQDPF